MSFTFIAGGRHRRFDALGLELETVIAVVDPDAGRFDEVASADRGRMARYGNEIALAAHPGAQHAEAVLGIVKGHALDRTADTFAVRDRFVPGWRSCLCGTAHTGEITTPGRLFPSVSILFCKRRPGVEARFVGVAGALRCASWRHWTVETT